MKIRQPDGSIFENKKWKHKIILLQPRSEAFEYLNHTFKIGYFIYYLEVTIDLIFKNQVEAELCHKFMDKQIVMTKHGNNVQRRYKYDPDEMQIIENPATFFTQKKPGINIAIYSDRPSKLENNSCCHLDRDVAIVISIQGVNPITGKKTDA